MKVPRRRGKPLSPAREKRIKANARRAVDRALGVRDDIRAAIEIEQKRAAKAIAAPTPKLAVPKFELDADNILYEKVGGQAGSNAGACSRARTAYSGM